MCDVARAVSFFFRDIGDGWGGWHICQLLTWEEELVALESLEPSGFGFEEWFAVRLPPATLRWFTPTPYFYWCLVWDLPVKINNSAGDISLVTLVIGD